MSEVVLDASALLALLNAEPGAESVALHMPDVVMSTVNLAEVVAKLTETGMSEREIRKTLSGLGIRLAPFDAELAFQCGLLRSRSRHLGLSLGDRACLSLARQLGAVALTTDSAWTRLKDGPKVEVVR